jgi:hypothetical protein
MTQSILRNLYQEELYRLPGKVIVVISRPWEEITLDDRTLLSKILGSMKLTLASVQIKISQEFSIEDFYPLAPTYIIAFGATLKNSSNKKYEHLSIEDISVILADELNELDDLKKRSLWLSLKQIFQ